MNQELQTQLQENSQELPLKKVPETEVAEVIESMEDYAKELEASFRKIEEGDILSGTVIHISEEGVILDLRYYTQGVIKAEDMSDAPDFVILQDVQIGDVIEASVVKMDDGRGNILMSRKAANHVLAWDRFQTYLEEKKDLTVKITGVTNGGAVCFLEDIRGFIPASQLALDYVEDVEPWLGKTVKVRVITVDKEKLVLSAKAVLKEEKAQEHAGKVAMIIPGSVLEGTVESLTAYGAFVNLGDGLSGLVHISQICQKRIRKPSEVLSVGEKVKCKVLNTNDGKISLSIKAVQEDAQADEIEEFQYESDGEVGTSLGSLFANLKLKL
jgi:small subunit ribosomal protein S1